MADSKTVTIFSSLHDLKFDEDQGMGVGLIIASLLCEDFWSVQSWCHFSVMEKWMKKDRSVWVGKSPGLMRGRWVACLAALSTAALPGMPQWPGTHEKMLDGVVFRGWVEYVCDWLRGEESLVLRWLRWRLEGLKLWERFGVRMRSFRWWWLLDWKWILRSSANRMVLRGKGIMKVILLMARMNKVPLKGEPCEIPFS